MRAIELDNAEIVKRMRENEEGDRFKCWKFYDKCNSTFLTKKTRAIFAANGIPVLKMSELAKENWQRYKQKSIIFDLKTAIFEKKSEIELLNATISKLRKQIDV